MERARLVIEQAEAIGEAPEDPLLLFSVLYGFWVASLVAFNGDAVSELATQFLAVAEKQGAKGLRMVGHRLRGMSLLCTGAIAEGRVHFDQAMALYDPAEHLPLATRFGQEVRVAIFSFRSIALWVLGYPNAALEDVKHALDNAREIGQVATLMYALTNTSPVLVGCGSYELANAQLDELIALADEKGASYWKAIGMLFRGNLYALTGNASGAVQMITTGITAFRSTGARLHEPAWLSYLAIAHTILGEFDDARRRIGEAMTSVETRKEKLWEAEVNRTAGEIALLSPQMDAAKAQAYFERALAVARQQQAKSWELRAAMSLARLWRDQGKPQQAREPLGPVHGWFTEGFDTRDLKEAKALLEELTP